MQPFISRFITLNVGLIPAAIVSQGLGPPAYLCIEDAAALTGEIELVTSAADVAALLTATKISAQAAADLTVEFSQSFAPAYIIVASYDTGSAETPDDALDRLEAASYDFTPISQESRANTDNAAVGTWIAASQERTWSKLFCAMSVEAELITSGKPSALAACEIDACAMHYHSATAEEQASAHAGMIGGFPLISGPMAMNVLIGGVTIPTLTNAEAVFAYANNVSILKPVGLGASASQRILDQTRSYSGTGWSGVLTLQYTVRRLVAAIQALKLKFAILATPLYANAAGSGEVRGALNPILVELFEAGHYSPGIYGTPPNEVPYPKGFGLSVSASGTVLAATVTLLIGQEAITLTLTVIGEEQ